MDWLAQNWVWLGLTIGAFLMMARHHHGAPGGGGCCGHHANCSQASTHSDQPAGGGKAE